MNNRTLSQNNFYFAVISDVHKQALAKHVTVEDIKYLRKGLKEIDCDYPKLVSADPKSSAYLTTKEMVNHIEFIIEFMGRFDIVPKFIDDEWARIQKQARE